MRTLILVVAASALCALGYTKLVRPKLSPPISSQALTRLSQLVETHIDAIFSPLTGHLTPIPQLELRKLREQFVDSLRTAKPRERRTYVTAVTLCDALLTALQEREREALSLADSQSKAYSIGLSADQRKDAVERSRFFEFAIARRWAESSKAHRAKVTGVYSQLREEERRAGAPAENPR